MKVNGQKLSSNLFCFDLPAISVFYSYNTPIALLIKERNVVFLTTEKYSVTTTKHKTKLVENLVENNINEIKVVLLPQEELQTKLGRIFYADDQDSSLQ
jgi:hypothetical protein